uniref:Uncharacterized protein n=1 Tax=Arundo donax TaxID=35708 RepID=A0A0A8XYK2_ARUDO
MTQPRATRGGSPPAPSWWRP